MAQVLQKDSRSGITYVYESVSWWDKEKKQSRSKRTLIGRYNERTGEIEPTDGRRKRKKSDPWTDTVAANIDSQLSLTSRKFYGATYLLDQIGDKFGIAEDLKRCFPDTYKQLLSIAYYLVLEGENTVYRFKKWGHLHKHPYSHDISSQRSSELLESVSEEAKHNFFRLQGKRRLEKEYWAYDTTSISSYSEQLKQIKYGHNKDHDDLPQLNLALVFGEQSGLPFYYRKLSGNMPDSKTVSDLLYSLDVLGYKKVKLVMDRGFYRESNINDLYKHHLKFLIDVKISLSYIQKELSAHHEEIRHYSNFNSSFNLFGYTSCTEWNYKQDRPYKKDVLTEKRRLYVHIFFDPNKAAADECHFNTYLSKLRDELLNDKRVAKHQRHYDKYFDIKTTPVRGIKVVPKEAAIADKKKEYGYFALISNDVKDAFTALILYRTKDVVEKAFCNIKDRLDFKRTRVTSELGLEGRLFVEFIALIYISYVHKQMHEKNIYSRFTMFELFDELDVIECLESSGRSLRVTELLTKQKQLFLDLDIEPPSSLCVPGF